MPTQTAAVATANMPVSFEIISAIVYVSRMCASVMKWVSCRVTTRVWDSANMHNDPPTTPTVAPIAILNRNMGIPYSMLDCGIVIHSKIIAARIMLTASFSTPSISRMLRILLFTLIVFMSGTMTVGPVAATSAPKRNAKPQSSPISSCAATALPVMVTATPTLTSMSTVFETA